MPDVMDPAALKKGWRGKRRRRSESDYFKSSYLELLS